MTTAEKTTYATDWNNLDLSRGYERDLNILDPVSSDALLLAIHCNLPVINRETVKKQFSEMMWASVDQANEIFKANLDNIVKQAKKERAA